MTGGLEGGGSVVYRLMKTWLCVGEGGHIHVCTPKCEQAENQEPRKSRDSFWFNCQASGSM